MFIKRKHRLVIVFSSLIVAVVFVSTLLGYNLYVQWKGDSVSVRYRNSIYKLSAELFRDEIDISSVSIETDKHNVQTSLPFVKGSLKNKTEKAVSSILVEVFFQRHDGSVIYRDWIYPLGESLPARAGVFIFRRSKTHNILLPGEGISFRHSLRNCPDEIVGRFSDKDNFAKKEDKNKIKIVYSIAGLKVL